jgi:hypothetical protein
MHELDLFVRVIPLAGCRIDLPTARDFGSPLELPAFDGDGYFLQPAVAAVATILIGLPPVDGYFRSELLRLGHGDLPFRMRRLRDLHESLPTRKDIGRGVRKLNRHDKRSGFEKLDDL